MRKYYRKRKFEKVDLVKRGILAEKRVKALRLNITKSEDRVLELLKELKFSFVFQCPFFDEWYFLIADFYLPAARLIIEVDGWSHEDWVVKHKEAKRLKWLRTQGIDVLRIKNKATINMTSKELYNRIERKLKKRK